MMAIVSLFATCQIREGVTCQLCTVSRRGFLLILADFPNYTDKKTKHSWQGSLIALKVYTYVIDSNGRSDCIGKKTLEKCAGVGTYSGTPVQLSDPLP